jgi:serine/threonine protein kinase
MRAPTNSIPGPTPSGYQRSPGGGFSWMLPSAEQLATLLPLYEIECLLGRGGMGAVFKGRQKSLNRPVAIKILPPEVADSDDSSAERFRNEAQVLAKFVHSGIVAIYDFGRTSEGQFYIVMEFVDGTDVAQMISSQRRLPPEHALTIAMHVCEALIYAHKNGVVHRDIKPANILINQEGSVKVADFGLAKLDEPGTTGLTKTGMAMGTPDYVAPEALKMGTQVDGRADLYAVGVMLYHMLTGVVPRGAFDMPSTSMPALDPRIDAVIGRAMKQLPEQRYQSAAELRADLVAILSTPIIQAGGGSSAAIPAQVIESAFLETSPSTSSATVVPQSSKNRTALFIGAGIILTATGWLIMPPSAPEPLSSQPETERHNDATPQPSSAPKLDPSKWLPFTYPNDFGKNDAGAIEAVDGGGVTLFGGYGQRLRANWTHQDLAVRARITLPASGVGIIGLRTDSNKPAVRVGIYNDRIDIISEAREDTNTSDVIVLGSFPGISSPFYQKEGAEITFAALGNKYHLWLKDQYLGSVIDSIATAGKALFDGENATFYDMQWQVIGDTAPPVVPASPAAPVLKAEDINGVWSRPGISSLSILYPDGKITLINKDGQEDRGSDNKPYWSGWRWRIENGKALLCSAAGALQEEWTLTQPGVVAIKNITKGSISTSSRVSTVIPAIRPTLPPAAPAVASKPAPQMPAAPKAQIPAELLALQKDYAASIATRVNTPHDSSLAHLNAGFTAALDRAVASQQLTASAILADKKAIASKLSLPPDTETTPDVLQTYRATYRTKASEIDDTRTTAHLDLLTPYVAKLRELEASLSKAGRTADAAAVKAYRGALSENPLALPDEKP